MSAYRKSAQVDMTHGSVLGRAALFALPICAGNILQLLYSTVDTLVIGNFCDTTALASVATSSQPLEILLCVFVGIGSGISILVSQAVGRGDRRPAAKARAHLGLAAVCSIAAADRHRVSAGAVDAAADAGPGGRHAGGGAVSAHHDAGDSGQHGL